MVCQPKISPSSTLALNGVKVPSYQFRFLWIQIEALLIKDAVSDKTLVDFAMSVEQDTEAKDERKKEKLGV